MIHCTHPRNRDFIRRCLEVHRQQMQKGNIPMPDDIVKRVLAERAPAYYVDFYRARHILSQAVAENRPPAARYRQASRQWNDMYRDLRAMIDRHPRNSFDDMVWQLCAGHAGDPRFYISPRRAMALLRRHYTSNQ